MTSTAGSTIGRVVVALLGTVVLVVVGVPLLAVWWLSSPAPAPSAEDAGTMDRLRDVAYALRDEKVRDAVDRGADLPAVARSIGVGSSTFAQISSSPEPGAGELILTGVHRTGPTGIAVDLIESHVQSGRSEALFERDARPWIGCYRVELPVLAIDTTTWTARDATCPTFTPALQHADRVHVDGATARPLLRPPCYGTTGYCPGG